MNINTNRDKNTNANTTADKNPSRHFQLESFKLRIEKMGPANQTHKKASMQAHLQQADFNLRQKYC